MPRSQFHELAMKIVDPDVTISDRSSDHSPDRSPAGIEVSIDADTDASPGLRPEVLGDAAQRQTKAMIHAALFKGAGEASTIGPYQVLGRIGEGGMGVVYAAYDSKLERKVALKLIRGAAMRRPEGRTRTLREARALARLSHPNVVHVYQVGEVEDEIYVAMEFLTGPTLRAWLAARRRTWPEVLAVFRQAGEGLAAAHRHGVIHRDFKPANVIVGDDGRVRVLDFGLAHFGDESADIRALPSTGEVTDVLLTQTGAVLGTPAYMAAEQFAGGRGDAKTDQFSFCTALYEALYGQRPFAGDKLDTLASAVLDGRVRPVKNEANVPVWLHRVVVRGLQPDPARRWPAMDALLQALVPPPTVIRRGRAAAVAASGFGLILGGLGYVYTLERPPPPVIASEDAVAQAQAQAQEERAQSHDGRILVEARAVLTRDPVATVGRLAGLAGDAPRTWAKARFLLQAAQVLGLPDRVLRAGDRALAEVTPLPGGGFLGRDELGAVWLWELSERAGTQILGPGAATKLLVAADAPVWAVLEGASVRVFGEERAQTIDVGSIEAANWRLASDGRALVATTWMRPNTEGLGGAVYLWDLTRPGSPPRKIDLLPEDIAVIAADASVVVRRAARGMRVAWPREGREVALKHRGQPVALSADGKFVVARPLDRDGVMDVVEIASGKSRRVAAETVVALDGADVLFTRTEYGRPFVRRESLASGATVWVRALAPRSGLGDPLIVDPANEQFAASLGDAWAVGDLRTGALSSFMSVPKDRSPQWAGAGALMVVIGNRVRIHVPETAPVQVRHRGSGCGLAPGGRWAVVMPHDVESGEFSRVELATGATTTFRCPTAPKTFAGGGQSGMHGASAVIDDAGQVAMYDGEGWSCWWDEVNGARAARRGLGWGSLVGMPAGAALAEGSEVEVWTGPEVRAQRWTAAAAVTDMQASPSGALLAVRSERGVEVLHVDTGAVMAVTPQETPMGKADLQASALAWSPDSTRLAVLDKVEGSLTLGVWDVVGEPREVGLVDHVTLGGHVLKDSPGRPANRITFAPGGGAVVLTHRHESLMRVDLATHETQQLEVPELREIYMRSETDAIGVDMQNGPFMIDFAARDVSPLTPNPEFGGSSRPPIRRGEDGSVWTCAVLGPGTLLEIAPLKTGAQETRGGEFRSSPRRCEGHGVRPRASSWSMRSTSTPERASRHSSSAVSVRAWRIRVIASSRTSPDNRSSR